MDPQKYYDDSSTEEDELMDSETEDPTYIPSNDENEDELMDLNDDEDSNSSESTLKSEGESESENESESRSHYERVHIIQSPEIIELHHEIPIVSIEKWNTKCKLNQSHQRIQSDERIQVMHEVGPGLSFEKKFNFFTVKLNGLDIYFDGLLGQHCGFNGKKMAIIKQSFLQAS